MSLAMTTGMQMGMQMAGPANGGNFTAFASFNIIQRAILSVLAVSILLENYFIDVRLSLLDLLSFLGLQVQF